ncbi:MAG: GNAT family N-acetyltransferase [Mucilaginibacter polytrichastri]|nr:GNAT family N-acetyltransferase [Mucilaginibacter polytrichastri]
MVKTASSPSIEQVLPEVTLRLRRDILYPGQELRTVLLPEDQDGLHYGLFYDNELAGVVSLFDSGNGRWQFRKLAILEKYQRKRFGSLLLAHLLDETERLGGNALWCNARLSATGFYKKFGFAEKGDTFSKGGIDYVIMEKALI